MVFCGNIKSSFDFEQTIEMFSWESVLFDDLILFLILIFYSVYSKYNK